MNAKLLFILSVVLIGHVGPVKCQEDAAGVRGRVTTLWGQPLAQAKVSFFQLEGIQGNSPTEQLIQQATTGDDGRYEVKALPTGQYRVDVSVQGYGHTEFWRLYLWRGAKRVLDVGVPMGMLDHIAQMEVKGTVSTLKQEAVKDATVTLTSVYNSSESRQVRTDERGQYSFQLMQEGDYIVHVSKPGSKVSVKTVNLRSGERKTVDLQLDPMQPNKRTHQ